MEYSMSSFKSLMTNIYLMKRIFKASGYTPNRTLISKIFKRIAELADSRCLSQEEQEKYDESLKAADDYYGVLMSYYMNGIDEGVAKGEARGIAKGEARGSYHKSLDIAKKMLLKDMDDESIMELTGLTQEQLHQLKS